MSELLFVVDSLNKHTGYDHGLLKEMFNVFKTNYPEYFEMLKERSEQNDWQGVSEIAHRAKSAVAIMGMTSIQEEFGEIELKTDNGDALNDFSNRLNLLESKIKIAVSQIENYIETLS